KIFNSMQGQPKKMSKSWLRICKLSSTRGRRKSHQHAERPQITKQDDKGVQVRFHL
ncbi:hypothetical protein L9F63_024591, partial [Diploptera punctata]